MLSLQIAAKAHDKLNSINALTSVAVVATAVTTIQGTASQINTLYTAASNGEISGLDAEGTGGTAETITLITDATVAAADVHTLKNTLDSVASTAGATSTAVINANVVM